MIEIVQSPNIEKNKGIRLFLAGGISNCINWQKDLCIRLENDERLKKELTPDINILIFNPRCEEIPEDDPQIQWEYERLQTSDIISFWFSVGSLNPITLFEYGSYLKSENKTIIVGTHPEYQRKNNVIKQTQLANPKIKVNEDFENFYNNIIETLLEKIKLIKT